MSEATTAVAETLPKADGNDTFKPITITSQEQLNQMFAERAARAAASEAKKYAGFEEYKKKADELDALKDAEKTELEKANSDLEEARKELACYQLKEQVAGWAKEVVQGTDVPPEVLRGSTKKELQEHFEQLKPAYIKETAPKVPGDGKQPKEAPGGGDWLREAINEA